MLSSWIQPSWPAPLNVKAVVSTRHGGVSQSPYDSFNLAQHVGDDFDAVLQNRDLLSQSIGLAPHKIRWLTQVHSTRVVEASEVNSKTQADGVDTTERGSACVVMTADCLPVLLCNKSGKKVAAIHAGWRGLANGILAVALASFPEPQEVLAWLGPAISQRHFEVGADVFDAFIQRNPRMTNAFLASERPEKYMADLYELARIELSELGVKDIYGGNYCTYEDSDRFYSFRRDGERSGRMASLIWLA